MDRGCVCLGVPLNGFTGHVFAGWRSRRCIAIDLMALDTRRFLATQDVSFTAQPHDCASAGCVQLIVSSVAPTRRRYSADLRAHYHTVGVAHADHAMCMSWPPNACYGDRIGAAGKLRYVSGLLDNRGGAASDSTLLSPPQRADRLVMRVYLEPLLSSPKRSELLSLLAGFDKSKRSNRTNFAAAQVRTQIIWTGRCVFSTCNGRIASAPSRPNE